MWKWLFKVKKLDSSHLSSSFDHFEVCETDANTHTHNEMILKLLKNQKNQKTWLTFNDDALWFGGRTLRHTHLVYMGHIWSKWCQRRTLSERGNASKVRQKNLCKDCCLNLLSLGLFARCSAKRNISEEPASVPKCELPDSLITRPHLCTELLNSGLFFRVACPLAALWQAAIRGLSRGRRSFEIRFKKPSLHSVCIHTLTRHAHGDTLDTLESSQPTTSNTTSRPLLIRAFPPFKWPTANLCFSLPPLF